MESLGLLADKPQSYSTVKKQFQTKLKSRFEKSNEGGQDTLLSKIYTELSITEGESEGHRIETQSKRKKRNERQINCNDLFKSPQEKENIRTVMTTGVAGIGKTVCVQKFILDWAEGWANQDVDFIFTLPFRKLNLFKNDAYSLCQLLLHLHPELKEVVNPLMIGKLKIILIFDGLDESKLPLNVEQNMDVYDPMMTRSLDVLMTNIIKGNLLPNAHIWITSRPAAVQQIPSKYIDRWTKLHGFNDQQKDEYFKNNITDPTKADEVITHIKKSKSLYIMCHIPVFCWILVSGLAMGNLPQSLTEFYIHFLLVNTKNQRHPEGVGQNKHTLLTSDKEEILKLSKLAYTELVMGNILFYEDKLMEYSIDVNGQTLFSGLCTELVKSDSVLYNSTKVFCFVHLSVQEFLAALYVFYSFVNKDKEALEPFFTSQGDDKTMMGPKRKKRDFMVLPEFLKHAVDKSLQSRNGNLDLFLRFLLGLSLDSNQERLQGLLTDKNNSSDSIKNTDVNNSSESIKNTAEYINEILCQGTESTERCVNLFYCLLEMKDNTLHQKIEEYMISGKYILPPHCSVLAYKLLLAEETLDKFDLTKYSLGKEGRKRLLVVLNVCRGARLFGCSLTEDACEDIKSALQSENSQLETLDLGNNPLGNAGVRVLSDGLKHTNCRLKTLSLADCKLTSSACQMLAVVLQSDNSHLKNLDLANNYLTDFGVKKLCAALRHRSCKLEELRLSLCFISPRGCEYIVSALKSNPDFHLTELDLSFNNPGDAGLKMLKMLRDKQLKVIAEDCSEDWVKDERKSSYTYSTDRTTRPIHNKAKGKRQKQKAKDNIHSLQMPKSTAGATVAEETSSLIADASGQAKLADFGLSRKLNRDQTHRSTDRAGTEYWEAAEILQAHREKKDPRMEYRLNTDIQVAGMLVYYILTMGEHHPFGENSNDPMCVANILKGTPSLKEITDDEAKDLIGWMILKDPKQRPTVEECLQHIYFGGERRAPPPSQTQVSTSSHVAPPPSENTGANPTPSQTEVSTTAQVGAVHKPGQDFFSKHKADLEDRLPYVLSPILKLLVQREALMEPERETVETKPTSVERNRALLIIIEKRGGKALEVFYEVLKEADKWLVEDLESNS
ncbi:nucleotide-binding oligomerization domain-containing protein 2-like isoform X2 [Alosa pseudoharengus]|uniref:nucleotide-binding oligomerization domain-containing protein 2-like isoform X2 n=1 Tax=Alosa pseudoharengus TaxID=34774 RepID=UPI003F8B41DD